MASIFLALAAGTLLGYFLRRYERPTSVAGRVSTMLVFALLFLLGLSVGANETITANFHHLGLEAMALSLASLTGSVMFAWLLYRRLFQATGHEK
jgi:uncharacterized membrane protein YbjE (DUF340 family)